MGPRSRKNPTTPAAKIGRIRSLNDSIDRKTAEIEALGDERDRLIASLVDDGFSLRTIASEISRAYVTVHKAVARARLRDVA